MRAPQDHLTRKSFTLLATALFLGACSDNSPVAGGPDSIILDTSPDAGIDFGFDLPGGEDAAADVASDSGQSDVEDDQGATDTGGGDSADDAGGDDSGASDVRDDRGGDDAGDDGGGDTNDAGGDPDAVDDPAVDLFDGNVQRELGEPCEDNDQCLSGRCESFGDERICTRICDSECGVDGLVCFDNLCTPENYCGTGADGRPAGPGCPCEGACDVNATCEIVDDVTEICDCNPGYDGDGFSCNLREPPWIIVEPEAIDFGTVGLLTSVFETITIENIGPEPRVLGGVRLARSPSQGFAVFAPFAFPIDVDPESEVTVDVRFRPTFTFGGAGTEYANEVVVESDDPVEPVIFVAIEGLAVDASGACLTFDETTVDFGFVDLDESESTTVVLSNCGTSSLSVDSIALSGSDDGLSIAYDPTLPTEIDSGESFEVTITYAPESLVPVQAVLTALAGEDAEAALRILGGYECPEASIDASGGRLRFGGQDRFIGRVGDEWDFDGGDSDDPADGDLIFTWNILAPEDSDEMSIDPDLSSESFSMVPDVPGRYVIELRVESDESGLLSCNVPRFIADAFPLDPAVVVELSWNNFADMDLHLMQTNEAGEFGPWGRGGEFQPDDAYWANLFADFGVIDEPADNAWHLGDTLSGPGSESVDLGELDPDRRYQVGVNYARRLGTASVTPTVTVRVGDAVSATYSTTMGETGFWVPVFIEGDGTLTPPDE